MRCYHGEEPSLAMFPFGQSFFELSLLGLFLLVPFLLLSQIRRRTFLKTSRIPPSPPGLPWVGNLHQVGSLPHRSLRELAEKHGPVMLLRLGRIPTLVVSSREAAQEITKTHDLIFATRPFSEIAKILFFGGIDMAFSPYGDSWRKLRKLSTTHLFSTKKVQSFRRVREEEVAFLIKKLSTLVESSSSSSPVAIDMSETFNCFANDILCRLVSGKSSTEDGLNQVFRDMIEENIILFGKFHVGDFFPYLRWLDIFFGLNARAARNAKRWDDVLERVTENHAGKSRADRRVEDMDFVDVLLALEKDPDMDIHLTRDGIKALLMDMFAAGTDTSYVFLEWAMTELVRSPKAMNTLKEEIRGIAKGEYFVKEEDLSKMSYLKAVLKEVLRLHPPAPLLLPRESMEDCRIQGYNIFKHTRVIINFWAIGRDPKIWEAPDKFQPERFINSPIDFKGNDFQFIPFGAGRRICPGMNLSIATTELALANIIHRFDWELPPGMTRHDMDMDEAPGLTVRKKHRLLLVAKTFSC